MPECVFKQDVLELEMMRYANKYWFYIYWLEKFIYTIAFVEASSFDAKETFC